MSQWKRTRTPTKGHYEISSFLRDSSMNVRGRLASNDFLLHVEIVRVGDATLDPPLRSKFRVHDTTEFLAAIQAKVELLHAPRVYYWHDIRHEYLEVVDVTLLPAQVRVMVEPVADNSAEMEIFRTLCRHVPIKDRRYRLKTYPHCFVGHEMVDYMVDHNLLPPAPGQPTRRRDAVHFGNLLWSAGKLVHVVDPHKPFQDKAFFYRFLMDGMPPTTRSHAQQARLGDVEEAGISITSYTWSTAVPSPQPLTVPENIVSIACGTSHCLALTSEGFVFSWGAGSHGQLGHADKESMALDTPCLIQALANTPIQAVYAGYHGSAAKGEGEAFLTWGALNSALSKRAQPRAVYLPTQWEANGSSLHVSEVALGGEHLMVLLATEAPLDGYPPHTLLYAWGANDCAQLGRGSVSQPSYEPRAVPGWEGTVIRQIACSRAGSGALTAEGDLYVWGDNSDHRLSTYTAMAVLLSPHKLTQLLKPVAHFSMGRDFCVALSQDSTLYLWGHPASLPLPPPRQLLPDPEPFALPRRYRDVKRVVAGEQHVLLLIMGPTGTHHVLALGASGEELPEAEDNDLYHELNVYAHQVILLAAGGEYSAAIAVDDREKILLAAAQGLYSLEQSSQRKKLLHFLQHDSVGEVQERTRKQLRQGRQQRRNKLVRSIEQRMLRGGGPLDRQCFELFQSSSVYSVRVSSYRILGEQHSAFKYISDEVTLTNEGLAVVHFTVQVPPPNSAFRLSVSPTQGTVGRESQVTLHFQALALQSGVHEDLLPITLRGSKHTYDHYVWYRVEAEVKLLVPEIPSCELEGGQRLGSGGSSVVSLLTLGPRQVAVKKFRSKGLSKEETDSFRNEILITSNLQHPNVIECVGVCLEYPTLALVLEYMPLRDLGEYVRETKRPRFAPDYLLRVCMDVAEGMAYLHERMVMHRDLKLDNILLHSLDAAGAAPCAKLTDFGTSTILAPSESSCEVGTARYMPLEVLEPALCPDLDESYDPRSVDVYSYGITVWALYNKSIPYPECQFTAQIIDTLKRQEPLEFAREADVAEEIESLVRACCHPVPHERPDFERILGTLLRVAEGLPSLNEPVSRLIKAHGGSRALVVRTKESIVRYQMETIDKKIDRIQSKEAELQDQLRQLESTLSQLHSQRQQFVSERQRLALHDSSHFPS